MARKKKKNPSSIAYRIFDFGCVIQVSVTMTKYLSKGKLLKKRKVYFHSRFQMFQSMAGCSNALSLR
jgi:hypothetical protein